MRSPFLLSVRNRIRAKHYSIHTEKSYIRWMVRFIRHHNVTHPSALGAEQINAFLTDLARRNVAPNTQAQALNALVFLYNEVLGKDLSGQIDFKRTKRNPKIPVFLERFEITTMLQHLKGAPYLAACLMYGSGLRVMEVCRLRYHDVDLHRMCLYVREAKGRKMRVVTLSPVLGDALRLQLQQVEAYHRQDVSALVLSCG